MYAERSFFDDLDGFVIGVIGPCKQIEKEKSPAGSIQAGLINLAEV